MLHHEKRYTENVGATKRPPPQLRLEAKTFRGFGEFWWCLTRQPKNAGGCTAVTFNAPRAAPACGGSLSRGCCRRGPPMTAKDYSSLDNGYIGVAYGGSRQYALRETLYRRVETTNIYV